MPGERGGSQAVGTAPPVLGRAGQPDGALDATFEAAPLGMALLEVGTGGSVVLLRSNPSLRALLGERPDGGRVDAIVHPEEREAFLDAVSRLDRDGGRRQLQTRLVHRHQSTWVLLTLVLLPASPRAQRQMMAFVEPVSTHRGEHPQHHLAMHDPLTGLPNRALLLDRIRQGLAHAERRGSLLAVLFVDLDDFKQVNDGYGHDVGDALLIEIAGRLRRHLRPSDTAARLGGDEFVVLVEGFAEEAHARSVAQRIAADLAVPYPVGDGDLRVTASIGIAIGRAGGQGGEDLVRDADIAMYRAKRRGKDRTEVYDAQLRSETDERRRVEEELRHALGAGQLRLAYQPIVDLETGRVEGVEALLRWAHPTRGLLAPAAFLDVAERSGLIVGIGAWVLQAACQQAANWRREGPGSPSLAVNVSVRELARGDFGQTLADALAVSGLEPGVLRLEITEAVFLEATMSARSDLTALAAQGVSLGIDDFGTGYSSLLHLQRFPVAFLKVDRSFVARLTHDPGDRDIVAAVVRLGQALGLAVVAEGVEDAAQLLALRELGCSHAQGFHLATPRPAAGMTELLRDAQLDLRVPRPRPPAA